MWVFVLAVVLVFLVLAAQYESWSLPLAVILVVPMCLLCAISGVVMAKMDVNIFTQIGFLVLVGLACKNAILIVEFAKAQRESGVPRHEATLAACRLRLRPIIMTSFAFIFGVVPLMLSEGAGAEMRRTLGTAVFAGMLGVTLFGIFLTPVFYYVIQWFKDRRAVATEVNGQTIPVEVVHERSPGLWQESEPEEEDQSQPLVEVVEPGDQEHGLWSGLFAGIAISLKLKFGPEAVSLLPEIRQIRDPRILQAVLQGIETANTPEELREIWSG
jgi:predicted RND superfamily exporter protein